MGLKNILIHTIRFYQKAVSPWLGSRCRFWPSCSEYAKQALILRGVWCGIGISARRVLKCHPFHPGGYDPVEQ